MKLYEIDEFGRKTNPRKMWFSFEERLDSYLISFKQLNLNVIKFKSMAWIS